MARKRNWLAAIILATGLTLTGCGGEEQVHGASVRDVSELSTVQRENLFWTEYEKRMGLVGTQYADPARAKQGSIEYGRALCDRLESGMDREVLVTRSATANTSEDEVRVAIDTATEFLCPEQEGV